jgi:hypothetical protein
MRVFFGIGSAAKTPKPWTADLPRTIFGSLDGRIADIVAASTMSADT